MQHRGTRRSQRHTKRCFCCLVQLCSASPNAEQRRRVRCNTGVSPTADFSSHHQVNNCFSQVPLRKLAYRHGAVFEVLRHYLFTCFAKVPAPTSSAPFPLQRFCSSTCHPIIIFAFPGCNWWCDLAPSCLVLPILELHPYDHFSPQHAVNRSPARFRLLVAEGVVGDNQVEFGVGYGVFPSLQMGRAKGSERMS